MKLYLAGPMTGVKDFNYPAFFALESALSNLGHRVVNPARNGEETLELSIAHAREISKEKKAWEWYLRRDIPRLIDSDGIVLLPGWQNSRGASLQVSIASSLNIPAYIFDNETLRPRITVIGLSGYARSGKDTVGQFLMGQGYMRASFADYIRKALYVLNPFGMDNKTVQEIIDQYGWEESKVHNPEIREMLQRMGSEVGRNMLGENVWVNLTLNNLPDGAKVVITDCRFPNEAQAVKNLGGEVWRVNRLGIEAANDHISEIALDEWNFDRVIVNDGSLEDLQAKVEKLIPY